MRDFNQGIIYVIKNTMNPKVYVGSTTTSLAKRWSLHKTAAHTERFMGCKLYRAMAEIGLEHFFIEALEPFPCDSKYDLQARKAFWIRAKDSTHSGYNSNMPNRTDREYYREHRYAIQQRHSRPWTCETCGSTIRIDHRASHMRIKKHLQASL